jgi:hypothetical protein
MSYPELSCFGILKSIIANIDGSTNTTWKVEKKLDLAKSRTAVPNQVA